MLLSPIIFLYAWIFISTLYHLHHVYRLCIVNWDQYTRQLTGTTDTQLSLTNLQDIDNAVPLITANIQSALKISSVSTTSLNN